MDNPKRTRLSNLVHKSGIQLLCILFPVLFSFPSQFSMMVLLVLYIWHLRYFLLQDKKNQKLLQEVVKGFDTPVNSVPLTLIGDAKIVGYGSDDISFGRYQLAAAIVGKVVAIGPRAIYSTYITHVFQSPCFE